MPLKNSQSNWIRDENSQESYIHVCKGSTEKAMRARAIEIRLHDISIFGFFKDGTKVIMEPLRYCPYCGVELSDYY